MKNVSIKMLMGILLVLGTSFTFVSTTQQSKAKDFIKLFYKHDGVAGNPVQNWYIENTSDSEAIRVVIKYTRGNPGFNDTWTRKFDVEPGEVVGVGTKSSMGQDPINARVKGARYL